MTGATSAGRDRAAHRDGPGDHAGTGGGELGAAQAVPRQGRLHRAEDRPRPRLRRPRTAPPRRAHLTVERGGRPGVRVRARRRLRRRRQARARHPDVRPHRRMGRAQRLGRRHDHLPPRPRAHLAVRRAGRRRRCPWVRGQHRRLRRRPSRIVVAGNSAGACTSPPTSPARARGQAALADGVRGAACCPASTRSPTSTSAASPSAAYFGDTPSAEVTDATRGLIDSEIPLIFAIAERDPRSARGQIAAPGRRLVRAHRARSRR